MLQHDTLSFEGCIALLYLGLARPSGYYFEASGECWKYKAPGPLNRLVRMS